MNIHKPLSCFAILLRPEVPENRLWVIVSPQQEILNDINFCNKGVQDSFKYGNDTFLIVNQGNIDSTYMQSIKRHSREAHLFLRYFTNQSFIN